eukprot:2884138-Rhodomonas_salina.2
MEQSQLVFIAFDLLMIDGTIVVEKPLSERRDMLRSLIKQARPPHSPPPTSFPTENAPQTAQTWELH